MLQAIVAIVSLVLVAIITTSLITRARYLRRRNVMSEARSAFRRQREWLEARFLKIASSSGRPRGLAWAECDFADEVSFARDRTTGELRALVGITVGFEAIEGGGMEDVEAVSNLRAATAVFRYVDHTWVTDGRSVFNLNPDETIRHFQHELEAVVDG